MFQVFAINRATEDQEKNIAYAVRYDRPIDNTSLFTDSYIVSERKITGVYTNDRPYVLEDKCPVEGNFVIVEMDYSSHDTLTLAKRMGDPQTHFVPTYEIRQVKEIKYADGQSVPAWDETATPCEDMKNYEYDKFVKNVWKDPNGCEIAYSLFIPDNYDPAKKYPLVTYWHGGPEKGNDNVRSMLFTQCAIKWATDAEQAKHPAFVLCPQCPHDSDWVDPDTYQRTDTFDAVCNILFHILDTYSIDETRIYNTGFSMGAMCAWDTTKRYPHLFAATVIYVGQFNYEGLERIADNHIWVFHAADDSKSTPGNIDAMETFVDAGETINRDYWDGEARGVEMEKVCQAQIDRGGHIMHTLFHEGMKDAHNGGWIPALSNEVFRNWVFSQRNAHPSREEDKYLVPSYQRPAALSLGFSGRDVEKIAAGNRHNLALLKDGSVYAWGFNVTGEIGNGAFGAHSEVASPVRVEGLPSIKDVAAGNNFSLALAQDGFVYGWGSNILGQLTQPNQSKDYPVPIRLNGLSDIISISAGDNFAMAVKRDGSVWTWGSNNVSQLGDGTKDTHITPVQVHATEGEEGFLSGCKEVSSGVRNVVAVMNDGTVRAWGDGEYGQVGRGKARFGAGSSVPFMSLDQSDPTGHLTNVNKFVSGRCASIVLKNDGSVYTWGLHRHGELGIGDYTDPNAGGFDVAFLSTVNHPTRVSGLPSIKEITSGQSHSLALSVSGDVYGWGYNAVMSRGVLGLDDDVEYSNTPVKIAGLSHIEHIYSGINHNFAIAADGTIYGWGNANNHRLGPKAEA